MTLVALAPGLRIVGYTIGNDVSAPATMTLVQQRGRRQLVRGPAHRSAGASVRQHGRQRVEQAFQQSGVPLTLTTDPTVPAAHMMSVVSGTSSHFTPDAIGETDLGRNGFNFIDQIQKSSRH